MSSGHWHHKWRFTEIFTACCNCLGSHDTTSVDISQSDSYQDNVASTITEQPVRFCIEDVCQERIANIDTEAEELTENQTYEENQQQLLTDAISSSFQLVFDNLSCTSSTQPCSETCITNNSSNSSDDGQQCGYKTTGCFAYGGLDERDSKLGALGRHNSLTSKDKQNENNTINISTANDKSNPRPCISKVIHDEAPNLQYNDILKEEDRQDYVYDLKDALYKSVVSKLPSDFAQQPPGQQQACNNQFESFELVPLGRPLGHPLTRFNQSPPPRPRRQEETRENEIKRVIDGVLPPFHLLD